MSDCGPTSAKQTRYMLRSSNANENCDAQHNEPTDRKRKRKRLKLMDLNDDCLLAIMERMKAVKLVDIAETCKRTQALAQNTFRLKHRQLDLNFRQINLKRAMRLLRNFGHDISSLTISGTLYSGNATDIVLYNKIFLLISRYCGKKLTELSLGRLRITPSSTDHMKQIFGSLRTLKLVCVFFYDCDLSPFTENLEVLKLNNIGFEDSLLKAIGQCTQLEELEIVNDIHIFPAYDTESSIMHLLALKKLKVLKINYQLDTSLQPFLKELAANHIPIERLELTNVSDLNFVDLYGAIANLKTIKVLKLIDVWEINDANLLSLAKGLKSLTELHVSGGFANQATANGIVEMLRNADRLSYLEIDRWRFKFNINVYNDMLKIIRNRPEHIKLELKFYRYKQSWYPDETLRANDKWLSVKEVIYSS